MRGPRTTRLRTWAVGLACGLCLTAGCNSKAPPQPQAGGGSTSSKAEKARKDAEALAVNAATAGATAQAQAVPEARHAQLPLNNVVVVGEGKAGATAAPLPSAPPAPRVPVAPVPPNAPVVVAPKANPRPGSPAVVRERVVSSVSTLESEADADALAQACELVARKLAELDPPVRYKPSVAEVKAEFVRKDSRLVRPPDAEKREMFAREGITGNLVYVEYDVEVTAEQVRELRAQERAGAALRLLGVLVAVAVAGFLFLRADEWTKGYLTSWLAIAAVVLAGGAAAVFVFI